MAIEASREGFLTLLRKKNFLRLWLAQLISMTILFASNYAILILVEEVTGSTTLVGLAIICFSLPALLFSAPAGVFVDHLDKRRVLWASNALRAIATLLCIITLLTNHAQLLPIYLLTFLISSIGQFFTPAEGSAIPMLVSENELLPALSLFNITFMLAQALGFILLAPLVLSLLPTFTFSQLIIRPIDSLYTLIAVLYLVCAVLIWLIPQAAFSKPIIPPSETLKTQPLAVLRNVWGEMVQGWNFIHHNKQLFLGVVQLSFAGILLLVIGELATPIVTKLLSRPATDMAFVFAPAGIGLVGGSVLMPPVIRRLGKSLPILIGSIALAIVGLLLPLSTLLFRTLQPTDWNTNPLSLIVVGLLMLLAGVSLDFINVPAQTIIQELTPDWIKGRVLALQLMLYNTFSIPIILSIGVIADLFGVDRVLYITAATVLVFEAWSIYYQRWRHPQQKPIPLVAQSSKDTQKLAELDEIPQ